MEKTPKVSVIINCYNSSEFLREAIDSVYAQTYTDWEIVFWDNQSTDGSDLIAQSYDSRLRYFRGEEFVSLGMARNLAVQQARGDFIAFLDADDVWLPAKLEEQLALLNARPDVALVYSDSEIISSTGKTLWFYSDRTAPRRGWVLPHLFLDNFIVCSTVLIRKKLLDEMPWFQPHLKVSEEYELFVRIAEKYQFDFVKEPLVRYRLHQGNSSWDMSRMQHESILISKECLSRCPDLRNQIGEPALRIRSLGLWPVTMGQALLLQGKVREAARELGGFSKVLRSIPKAVWLYSISMLGVQAASRVFQYWRLMRRKFAYGT